MSLANSCHSERLNIVYLNVLDARTPLCKCYRTYRQFIEGKKKEWFLIAGDSKVYEYIKYSEELNWVLHLALAKKTTKGSSLKLTMVLD